jgi:stage II sporulation protein D
MTRLLPFLLLVLGSGVMGQAPAGDGGGRDVSVALFSTHAVGALTIAPIGPRAWTARCGECVHVALTAPIHVSGTMNVFAGGTIRVTEDATGEARTATGLWHVKSNGEQVDAVLTLPSERYVAAVLSAEAATGEPAESLRALAILARTYALNGSHYSAQAGQLAADLCDSTQCQAMALGPASPAVEAAVRDTVGETLWFGGRRAEVFFSQSCGGTTEDAGAVWPKLTGVSYLRSHADPYCIRRDSAAWHAEIALVKLGEIAKSEGWHLPAVIATARVKERSASHRALRVEFAGANGASVMIAASSLRFGIGRALGWNQVRSDAYEVGVRNGALVFDGRGHGHGVGLCQTGATEMAAEGKSAREILAFYFPGTAVRILPGDDGWRETRIGQITARSTAGLSADRTALVQRTWDEAQRRFPPHHTVTPEITFAPTTEVFRQRAGQPGWALASTSGNAIVLQPEAVLRVNGQDGSRILLHEMLHVLVEAESSERAPLWLREGLVEVLAGEPTNAAADMSVEAIDDGLVHADSLAASQRAHRAAGAKVQGLVARYGLSAVRGWLSSGVPSGVS